MPRCPNGSRKNKKGECECKVGWIKYKSSCVPKLTPNSKQIVKRCPTGSRKNKNRICECKDKTKIIHKGICINKESKESKNNSIKSAQEIYPPNTPISEKTSTPSPNKSPNKSPKKNKSLGRYNITPGRNIEQHREMSAIVIQKKTIEYILNKLSKICPNVSDCLLIGKYRPYILKWFNYFDLRNAHNKVKRIGIESNNATILELEYSIKVINGSSKHDYISYAILKSNIYRYTDNLWYEYKIGKYLNQFHKYLPMFVETYNLYKYNNTDLKDKIMAVSSSSFDINKVTGKNISELMDEANDTTLIESCNNSENYAFTSQVIQNSTSLYDMVLKNNMNSYDLASVIFQVYFGLCTLNKNGFPFAHYDLHSGNVLLYKPFGDNLIHYRFHLTERSEVIDIYSSYMIKIIDYGRSFMKDTPDIFNELTLDKYKRPCGRDHGIDKGFFLGKYLREDLFINYVDINLSHDLRLLENIRQITDKYKYYPDINPIFKRLQYNVGIKKPERMSYGTQPNNKRGGLDSINNIWDAMDNFLEYIVQNQRNVSDREIKSTIDIYDDIETPLKLVTS
jgi:hypothetical protein